MGDRPNRPLVYLLREPVSPDPFEAALEQKGFRARSFPVLTFSLIHQEILREAISHPDRYSGLILTSPRGVEALAHAASGGVSDGWHTKPAYVVGPATAKEAAEKLGLHTVGEESGDAEALANVIASQKSERPLLFICGNRSLEVLPNRMKAAGIPFERICAYETHLRSDAAFPMEEPPDWVAFFSPSGVEAVQGMVKLDWKQAKKAAIGATTAHALRQIGWTPDAIASDPTPAALARALLEAS